MNASATAISSVVLVGGPDSGKSNYIFRLWLAMSQGGGKICRDGLPDRLSAAVGSVLCDCANLAGQGCTSKRLRTDTNRARCDDRLASGRYQFIRRIE